MAATNQSSTQQVPMIDVWKSCTLCSAVVITSLRVLESNYSLFHKSQNHLIEFTVYFTKIRFGRTFPRKTRCSWRCLDVFIQSFRVDFLYEKCVERTVRKKHKKIMWLIRNVLPMRDLYMWFLSNLHMCDSKQHSVPTCFSVCFAMLSMWIIFIADGFVCACVSWIFWICVNLSMRFLCVQQILSSSIPDLSLRNAYCT